MHFYIVPAKTMNKKWLRLLVWVTGLGGTTDSQFVCSVNWSKATGAVAATVTGYWLLRRGDYSGVIKVKFA